MVYEIPLSFTTFFNIQNSHPKKQQDTLLLLFLFMVIIIQISFAQHSYIKKPCEKSQGFFIIQVFKYYILIAVYYVFNLPNR